MGAVKHNRDWLIYFFKIKTLIHEFVSEFQHILVSQGTIYNPLHSCRCGLRMFHFIVDNMHS